jgi:hypothetical protein
MSALMHPTMQQLADSVSVLGCTFYQSVGVHCCDCHEQVKAADGGLLPMSRSETQAKAQSQDELREFRSELPTTTRRQRHDLLASTDAGLMCPTPEAKRQGAKP